MILRLPLSLLFLLLPLVNQAQAQGNPFANPTVEHIGLDEGLPHRINYSAVYDQDSLLWLTTETSISRFDGYQITNYEQFNRRFRGTARVGADGYLYVIPYQYPDSVEFINPVTKETGGAVLPEGLGGAYAGAGQEPGAPVFFAAGGAVYRYTARGGAVVIHELRSEIQPGDRLLHAGEDFYYLLRSATNTVEELTRDNRTVNTPVPPLVDGQGSHLGGDGRLWLNTTTGTFYKLPGRSELTQGPELPAGQLINRIYEDGLGRLLFGHVEPGYDRLRALICLDGEHTYRLDSIARIDPRVIDISGTDFFREINLSTFGGYNRVSFPDATSGPFRRYLYDPNVRPGEFGHVMRGFTADDEGNVYANKDTRVPYWFRINYPSGTLDTLLVQDESGEPVGKHDGCGTNMLNYQGDVYGHTCYDSAPDTSHIYRYRPADESWRHWTVPYGGERVRWMMTTDRPDRILLITQGMNGRPGGLYYFYPGNETTPFERILTGGAPPGIAGYPKHAVFDTTRRCVWIAATKGLFRFEPGPDLLSRYDNPNGRVTEFSDILLRENGTLLLGTFKEGLLLFDPATETFERVGGVPNDGDPVTQTEDYLPLPSNDIAALCITPEKYLLVTTFNGISIHGQQEGPGSFYSTADGLPSNEFNTPSLFYNDRDKRWYAGGINGFVVFRLADLDRQDSPFRPVLLRTRYLDENEPREQSAPLRPRANDPLVIPPSVSYFYLDFTLPDYSARRAPRYQTKLVGLDDNWRSPTESPTVRYTRLPPGEYLFELRAIDGSGRLTAQSLSLPITVLKPWYRTNWFYALCALFAGLMVAGYVAFRERRLREKYRTQRHLQELELKTLRQQLNPHFISNAMNAIRDVVYEHEPDEAAVYLTDFSRLMRLFLEASRQRFTTIGEEIDLLRRYIRLEQLRFPGKFDYRITTGPELDPEMDEVPSLILQPIVENAINHGLYHLRDGGLLTVNFALDAEDEDVIVVTVSDNGVGRKLAATLKSDSPGHVSRSTQILQDRQQLLAGEGSVLLEYITTDLHPEREHTGTRVIVRVEPAEAAVT